MISRKRKGSNPLQLPLRKGESVRILAIETSCDETSVAILGFTQHASRNTQQTEVEVEQNLVSSQIPIHQKYGGVVPEVAARSHVPETVALITEVMRDASGATRDFDVIAVTRGPGLATALSVGVEAARTLAYVSGKPIIGVNHLEGHMASAWLNAENRKHWKFPLLALIVSGGHTELVLMKDFCKYKIVGQTRDDASGEAFDKSAKLMGLPYPGGPQIAKHAEGGDPKAFNFPRPMMKDKSLDFSFSGLKTAVRQEWERLDVLPLARGGVRGGSSRINDFAASLQEAIVDVLVEKTIRAAKKYKIKGILVVGGVSANQELRRQLGERIEKDLPGVAFLPSDRSYVTDNAAMIGAAGYWRFRKKDFSNWKKLEVDPELNV